ncbi:MAG: glycosyltransferase family 39 protein [Candidatus Peribacteraceae bacterium]|nr:glycosyltransferase family 39 protein [Candidatus Peribacteraceae bacterium]MDD5074983.1 glycosyltransferase family 39 protein [Candidatus Peribacteraceae bacterium]
MQKRTIQILSVLLFVCLLLWGGYTFLVYIGLPSHASVFLDAAAKEALKSLDCANSPFSCGLASFFPFLLTSFNRIGPFFWYIFVSVLLYALILVPQAFKTGEWKLRMRLTPAKVIGLFVFLLWVLFTVLSNSETATTSARIIAEPSRTVFADASPQVLAELRRNFDALKNRGCLTQIGTYKTGDKAYSINVSCIQDSFLTRVIPPLLFVLIFLFELLTAGRLLLHLCRFPRLTGLTEAVISAGVGACFWIALLWTIAILHIIIAPVAWTLVVLLPILGWRHALHWLKQCVRGGEEISLRWHSILIVLFWLLLSYLALNYLIVVRPFPIGWDDLGSYLNRPRLMVSYGSFIFSMASFQWEYLTSLGFLLFGYGSVFGATSSMMVNWTAGLLALLAVYVFARIFLGRGHGLLSAVLYYTLPLVGHFSFADMKIDNGVFFMGALGTIAIFLSLFPTHEQEEQEMSFRQKIAWVALAGIFVGFGFSLKPTVIMVIMALGTVLVGASLHWTGFIGAFFFALAVFVKQGVINLTKISDRVGSSPLLQQNTTFIIVSLLGLIGIGTAVFLGRDRAKRLFLLVLVFGAAFLASIAPWAYRNSFLQGNIIPTTLEFGAPNPYNPQFDIYGTSKGSGPLYRPLPPELRADKSLPACRATGTAEELDRYWGNTKGWGHYLTLPWRTVMNLDSVGYYVTTIPALLLFPLLLLVPFFWAKKGRWLRWLTAATAFMLLEWMFLANGIPWYGIGVFFGLVIGLEALVARSPDIINRTLAAILIFLSLIGALAMRSWQFEVQRNMLEYSFGKISAAALQERTVSHYDDIATTVLARKKSMPDRPYLYRIGTFIPYFIPRNLEIIAISDHQLDFFNCLYAERNPELTLKRLKALGFNSIIFDTNTATIERDANGSLHKKVGTFLEFANTQSLGIVPVVNDRDAGVAFMLLP